MNDYKEWYEEAIIASNELGFAGVSAADVIRYQAQENEELKTACNVNAEDCNEAERILRNIIKEYTNSGDMVSAIQQAKEFFEMTSKIAVYKDLLKVVKKHSETFDRENVTLSPEHLKSVVEAMEVSERFGIPLQGIQSGTHLHVKNVYDDWTGLSLYGEKYGRTIGCSDNGKQPKSEWLFKISFPCGAYTFGGDGLWDKSYPKKTFDAFFDELKSFGTAFSDTMNNALYFREDNSKAVYEAFWGIFNKYKAMVADELKEQRKQELVKELEALENKQ